MLLLRQLDFDAVKCGLAIRVRLNFTDLANKAQAWHVLEAGLGNLKKCSLLSLRKQTVNELHSKTFDYGDGSIFSMKIVDQNISLNSNKVY